MLNNVFLKEIDAIVRSGNNKFIVYPYGKNGKEICEILENDYKIKPIYIVDNELAEGTETIINLDVLKKVYNGEYIILTIENMASNTMMYNQLIGTIPNDKIINILSNKKNTEIKCEIPDFSNFKINNILNIKDASNKNKKIKIRILSFSELTWNSIKSICMACNEDINIDFVLVTSSKNISDELKAELKKENIKFVNLDEYKIENDLPDIMVINHPYDIFSEIKDCRKYCKLIVVASMQLVRYSSDWSSFWNQQAAGFGRFYPDCFIFDSLLYNDIKSAGYSTENIYEMGNAKFDGIYECSLKRVHPENWEKIKGKKVILWTTDHGVHDGKVTRDVTFDLYSKKLFQYAREHENIGFIFRPHKALINELLSAGLWTKDDFEFLKEYCNSSKNIVYDENLTYNIAYSIADGIITDAYCGIICSALPLLKPMCFLYRSKGDVPLHKELSYCNYAATNWDELEGFINIVIENKDFKLELREQTAKMCIKNFDGKNGWRIKELLKKLFCEKFS